MRWAIKTPRERPYPTPALEASRIFVVQDQHDSSGAPAGVSLQRPRFAARIVTLDEQGRGAEEPTTPAPTNQPATREERPDAERRAAQPPVDLLLMVDTPSVAGPTGWRHGSDEDQVVRATMRRVLEPEWAALTCRLAYAVERVCEIPSADDLAAARTRVAAELAVIRPKMIVAAGRFAAMALGLDGTQPPGAVSRGAVLGHRAEAVITYSPRDLQGSPWRYLTFAEHLRFAVGVAARGGEPTGIGFSPTDHTPCESGENLQRACERCLTEDDGPIAIVVDRGAGRTDIGSFVLGYSWGEGRAAAVVLPDASMGGAAERRLLTELLASPRPKVLHNAKLVLGLLDRAGLRLENLAWDTLAVQHLLSEDLPIDTSLLDLVRLYLPSRAPAQETRRRPCGSNFAPGPPPVMETLAATARDADHLLRVHVVQRHRLAAEDPDGRMRQLVDRWLVPVTRLLVRVESAGLPVDGQLLESHEQRLSTIAVAAKRFMREKTGRPNLNPTADGEIDAAFRALPGPKADGGIKSHADGALAAWCAATGGRPEEFVAALLAGEVTPTLPPAITFGAAYHVYAKATKAGLPQLTALRRMVGADGHAHPELHLHGTATGRLSSATLDRAVGMNFQNLAHDSALEEAGLFDVSVRQTVRVPTDDRLLVQVDVRAAEVRSFTAYTRDPVLVRALLDGIDPHCAIASDVFGDATHDEYQAAYEHRLGDTVRAAELVAHRAQVKGIVFGTMYGSSAYGIAKRLFDTENPTSEQLIHAQRIIDSVNARIPSLPAFVEETRRAVNRQHAVASLLGRRRRFPQLLLEVSPTERARCHRQAVNFKVQSLASDILVCQLAEMDPHLDDLKGRLLLTVHDSGLFEIDRARALHAEEFFRYWITERVAQKFPWLPVPFDVEVQTGENYGQLRPIAESDYSEG